MTADVLFTLTVEPDGSVAPLWMRGSHERLTGYGPDEMIALGFTTWLPIVHGDDLAVIEEAGARLLGGDEVGATIRLMHRDGGIRWICFHAIPEVDGEGRVVRILGSAGDVTGVREAEAAAQAAVAWLSEAQALAGLATWRWNEERRCLTGSPELAAILGVAPPVHMSDETFYAMVHRDDVGRVEEALRQAEADLGAVSDLDFRLVHPDGEIRCLTARGRAEVGPDGAFAGFLGTVLDVTDVQRMEEALRASEARYRTLVELSPSPILIERSGRLVYANPAAARFLAAPGPDDLVGRPVTALVAGTWESGTGGAPWATEPSGGDTEAPLMRADGQLVYAEVRWAPVEFGGAPATQVVLHDVTQRRLVELALQSALAREREAAERTREAERLKDGFLTQISHELRTPLTPVIGFALTLRDRMEEMEGGQRRHMLDRMVANAEELARMVERLLDVTQLHAGGVGVRVEPVGLAAAVERHISEHASFAGDRVVEVDVRADLVVIADVDGLDRVLGNLISNAVKYSPADAPVLVTAEPVDDAIVSVRVEDRGPGVPEDLRGVVFERFVQGPDQPSGFHGTGVGLAVARAYVEMMGGAITIVDTEDGTAVEFTLRRAPASAPAETGAGAPNRG
jgi:PAS domain S-box-containing protein